MSRHPQQMPDRLALRRIVLIAVGALLVLAAALVVSGLVVPEPGGVATGLVGERSLEHAFRSEDHPARLMRQRKAQELHEYRWIDRERGIVGIPLEEAMQRYLRRRQVEEEAP